jgi:hypothetical protein
MTNDTEMGGYGRCNVPLEALFLHLAGDDEK